MIDAAMKFLRNVDDLLIVYMMAFAAKKGFVKWNETKQTILGLMLSSNASPLFGMKGYPSSVSSGMGRRVC